MLFKVTPLSVSKTTKQKSKIKFFDSIPMIRNIRYRRDQRQLEEEEEIWFNEEDDFTDVVQTNKPDIESYSEYILKL